jgi:tetratricopeptide (TPR) repeat protein
LEGEELVKEAQSTIQELCWSFYFQIWQLANNNYYTNEQKLKILEKAKKMYELVYDEEDYLFSNIRLEDIVVMMAQYEIAEGHQDKAIKLLQQALKYTADFEDLPREKKHSSLLVNRCEYKKANTTTSSEKNEYYNLLQHINRIEGFKALETNDLFIEFIDELKTKCN